MIKDMTAKELMHIVQASTTYDGRISPDYTNSFQLKEVIDELAERAYKYDDLSQ